LILWKKKVDQVLDAWNKNSSEGCFSVGDDIQKMTLDVLGLCIFGKDFNFFGGVEKGPLYDYNQFMKSLRNIAYAFVPKWLFYTIPFGGIKRIRDSSKSLDEYIRVLEKESTDKIDDRTTLLNMLIEANSDKKLSKTAIRDNILIFFIAGHETTATTLQFVVYHLATHPEIQERLREEVNQVFPNAINPDGLKDLHLALNIINESLRLFPPAGILSRYTFEDQKLGDYIIPKDTNLNILGYGLQRDSDIWGEDAEIFNPDRFDHLTKDQSNAFIPFGGGPRICIGNTFSLYEQKIFIAKLMKRFKFSLDPSSKLIVTDLLFSPQSELLKYNFKQFESTT